MSTASPDTSDVLPASKEAHSQSNLTKLVGHIPGAYENIFCLERGLEDDDFDDDVVEDMDSSQEGQLCVLLTREEKQNLQQPWRSSLIVKLFGKSFELQYFTRRIKSLWNPSRNMECVDLGYGFFLVTFNNRSDFSKVIRDGPWFVGRQFLTMRLWEPCFRPSKATFSAVTVGNRILISSGHACARLCNAAWEHPPSRGRAMDAREKESPLTVYDP
ncbi:hypothetical protein CRG98_044335 [Punica granatum]|uniref:DUF4283 domain-containing protein n=1 Tax=Punica granatum TaxID=22663 RepID=A0A2I0HU86_PUNGR|nr:hypothetical protein CRG98_044335 [Punica granatum]